MYGAKREHKNILEMIDSINIVSTIGATLLMLNWEKYKVFESAAKAKPDSTLDIPMLNALMQVRCNVSYYREEIIGARLPDQTIVLILKFLT
jgi:hypothetical protein